MFKNDSRAELYDAAGVLNTGGLDTIIYKTIATTANFISESSCVGGHGCRILLLFVHVIALAVVVVITYFLRRSQHRQPKDNRQNFMYNRGISNITLLFIVI